MRYKLFGALVVLAVAGTGSATLLDVYGTVSGTADVKPALDFVELQSEPPEGEKEYILLENSAGVPIDVSSMGVSDAGGSSDDLTSLNKTSEVRPGHYILVTEENTRIKAFTGQKKFIHASTTDSGITSSLVNTGEKIFAEIDRLKIESFDYTGTGCTEENVSVPEGSGSCEESSFEVVEDS